MDEIHKQYDPKNPEQLLRNKLKNVERMMKQSFLEAYKRTNSIDTEAMFFEEREGQNTQNNERRIAILN